MQRIATVGLLLVVAMPLPPSGADRDEPASAEQRPATVEPNRVGLLVAGALISLFWPDSPARNLDHGGSFEAWIRTCPD